MANSPRRPGNGNGRTHAGRGGEDRSGPPKRRSPPPDATGAEAAYIEQLKEEQAVLDFTLQDGTTIRGTITYFDREMVKIAPESGPTRFVRKSDIRLIAETD